MRPGFFVTCELDRGSSLSFEQSRQERAFCLGTDYGHSDRAAIRGAHRIITERDDIDAQSKSHLTSDNARNLYALT